LDVQAENSKGREEVPCQSPVLLPFIFYSLRRIKIDLKGRFKFLLFKERISATLAFVLIKIGIEILHEASVELLQTAVF